MDLITADPSKASSGSSSTNAALAAPSTISSSSISASSALPSTLGRPAGEKRSKRAALMQIQNDTISAAKAALNPVRTNMMPQRLSKKKVPSSYMFHVFFLNCCSWHVY